METESKVCPSCNGKNDAVFTACWKCGAVFEDGTGEKKRSSRAFPTVVSFAVAIVLIFVFIPLSKSLIEFFFGGKGGSGGTNVSEDPGAVTKRSSGAKKTVVISGKSEYQPKAPGGPGRTKELQEAGGAGGYHLLVTTLPGALASKKNENEYFKGLIETYLHSHAGSALSEKNELMLQDKYRALEYKIGFQYSKDGFARPYIHHAITAVVADKVYTVSVDYPRDISGKSAAMRKNLMEALPKF